MGRIVVLALGGNALTHHGQAGTHEQLAVNAEGMARSISSLMLAGWEVVLVHGNGPQVGNLALQQEEGSDVVPAQPLFSLGAMTQGQLGSLFALALRKVLGPRAPEIVPLVTHSEVDPNDPAFEDPTKPIGPFLTRDEAQAFAAERGWAVKEDAGRGWRRVVPSPEPVRILESGAIRALLDAGLVVIAAGGGGIPVVPTPGGHCGVDAVIDKDYAAERLATSLGAEALVLVTSVEAVLLDYGTPRQRAMLEISVEEAETHLADGQFPEGSMGPKVRAGVRFLRNGGDVSVITTPALVYASLEGTVSELEGRPGTRIVRVRPVSDPSGERRGVPVTERRSHAGPEELPDADRRMAEVRAAQRLLVLRDRYVDSVVQMAASRAMMDLDGVEWAAAAMGTPANLETLAGRGFDLAGVEVTANDCFLAVQASSDGLGDAGLDVALDAGEAALSGGRGGAGGGLPGSGAPERPRSFSEAVDALDGAANLAIVSVPGDYASLEAHKALSAGLHVLLFSDNVSLEEEVELKERAEALGLLVMGPGAGTAMLGRTGLGFANVVGLAGDSRPGVGVVAAAGTGAQEVMALLDRGGARVTAVIGVGGRDLSETVGGRMAKSGLRALGADPGTDAVLLVSKPPSEAVARAVLAEAGGKPAVAALIGLAEPVATPDGVRLASTLEGGATTLLAALGLPPLDLDRGLRAAVTAAVAALPAERTLVRGLFSGGTLCYEALEILSGILGPVYSNTPIRKGWGLPAPDGAHVCLDLGEEEFTKGRPHPMIDPEARIEHLRVEGARPDVAVVLLDVVLGYGAHDDPAGRLAPVCADIVAGGRGPAVVAYVLGTDGDPQGLAGQRATLEAAGCIVPPTAGRAALAAAALAARRPELVEEPLS